MIMFVITCLITKIFRQEEELELSLSHLSERPVGMKMVSIMQWHSEIGIFNAKLVTYSFKSKYWANVCPHNLILSAFFFTSDLFLIIYFCTFDSFHSKCTSKTHQNTAIKNNLLLEKMLAY